MAIEGGNETVVVDGGAPSSDGATKPVTGTNNGQNDGQPPVAGAKPAPGRDYDKEIAGLRNDLQKERRARQQYDADLKAAKAEVEAERRRVQALAGVTPKSQADQDDEAIKAAFAQKFPHLAGLTEEDVKAMREMREQQKTILANTEQQWKRHNQNVVNELKTLVSKEIGGTLTERQTNKLVAAYVAAAEADEQFLQRHQNGDPELLKEFAAEWVEDFFEPARRKVTQQEVQRQRVVPSGKDRGIVTHGEKKIDVNDSKAVEDMLVKSFREKGGSFGRG
jgi:membrane-associated HD superfamily phosphohydrolase